MDKPVEIKNPMALMVVLSLLVGGFSTLHALELQAAPKAEPSKTAQVTAATIVSLNKAGLDELQTVRGIGPALAERIMKYRDEHGKFEHVEDLVNVRGIGEAKFQKIKNQISI